MSCALIEQLRASLAIADGDHITEDERDHVGQISTMRDAAVLIAITDRARPGVLLTQRPQWLRSHAGQVALPGGKVDAQDRDAIDAALREADEELGIVRHAVTVLGVADVYHSGSGYRISPVVGLIAPDLDLSPNPDEVEGWFEAPLELLCDSKSYTRHRVHYEGRDRIYYELFWQDRRIWGVTAGIFVNLARRIGA